MSNQIVSFNFQNNQVRTVIDSDGELLFCLSDVCKILALKNPINTVNQIEQEFGKGVCLTYTLQTKGGKQDLIFITEPQFYFVVYRSRAKIAHEFRMWVNCEVLPAIRKHGAYIAPHKEDDKSFIETFKNFCLKQNYSSREVEMFNWFGEMKLKQGYAIAMAKVEKEQKNTDTKDDSGTVSVPFSTVEYMLRVALFLNAKREKYRKLQNALSDAEKYIHDLQYDAADITALTEIKMPVIEIDLTGLPYSKKQKAQISETIATFKG